MNTELTIPEFFAGKNVFITGGSGFMGKGLIEKLLRSCPEIGNIYLLMRDKRGKSPEERLEVLMQNQLYDKLKKERPDALKKLKPVVGDVFELGLGLSIDDRNTLTETINIVYHAAASVRFDDPLKNAILLNTRGTREVISLSLQMKHLDLFVYVSTTYCNVDQDNVIEERIYPSHTEWRTAIEIAEQIDRHTLDVLCPKYLGKMPNTYTYTKALSEHVVFDMCNGKIPAVIFRPSIVTSTLDAPVQGWHDNFNGPNGIVYGVGIGLLRTIYSKHDQKPDYIPLDVCINGLVVTTWHEAMQNTRNAVPNVSVYNGCGGDKFSMTVDEVVNTGLEMIRNNPMSSQIWYPSATVTSCKYEHFLKVIFFQLLPAIFFDSLLRISGRKTKVFRIQRKIYIAMKALEYFTFNNWTFVNEKFMKLNDFLKKEDYEDFWFKRTDFEPYDYCKKCMHGGQLYLLHENLNNIEANKKHGNRLKLMHFTLLYSSYLALFLILFYNLESMKATVSSIYLKYFYV